MASGAMTIRLDPQQIEEIKLAIDARIAVAVAVAAKDYPFTIDLPSNAFEYKGVKVSFELLDSFLDPETIPSRWMRVVQRRDGMVTIESQPAELARAAAPLDEA